MLSRRAGLLAAVAVAVGAPYLLTSRFVYTDALQLFLLLIQLFWTWRLVSERPRPRLVTALGFGLSLALLFNTKYSAYLYALALLAARAARPPAPLARAAAVAGRPDRGRGPAAGGGLERRPRLGLLSLAVVARRPFRWTAITTCCAADTTAWPT